ncbi:MAG TPA: NDP-sugar synthase [Bacillota bacterium]|nr:NDP-sugar synthase [Bacillota bacterium]
MKALLLAGGRGTRLHPLTTNQPKPMLPVLNRPWLEYLVELLVENGITEMVFSLCHCPDIIINHFGDGSRFGVKIEYVVEQTQLGTGGAIKMAAPKLSDPFLAFNADIVTDINLRELLAFHEQKKALGTLTLTPVSNPSSYGVVKLADNGRILEFVEKPSLPAATVALINAGVYVFKQELVDYIPAGRPVSIEREIFPALIEKDQPLFGYNGNFYWLDMGTQKRYLQLHQHILTGRFKPPYSLTGSGIWVHPTAIVEPLAVLNAPCFIGPNCHIASRAELGPMVVLGENVTVEKGSIIRDSVLWDGASVGKGTRLEQVIVGKGVRIAAGDHLSSVALAD